jgi:hypothetical protein
MYTAIIVIFAALASFTVGFVVGFTTTAILYTFNHKIRKVYKYSEPAKDVFVKHDPAVDEDRKPGVDGNDALSGFEH